MNCKSLATLSCSVFLLVASCQQITAQNTADVFQLTAKENAMATYHRAFGDQIALFNGKRYIEYPFRFNKGDPYFLLPDPVKGSVFYDGVRYDSVFMRYNEVIDELIINYYNERIQLLKPKLEWFSIPGGFFIKLYKDSSSELVSSGFYNLLYSGSVSLLKKEVKSIQTSLSTSQEIPDYVEQHDHYYIQMNGVFKPVRKKKDLLVLFADKKQQVQQFIKSNSLSFRRDRQNMLTQTTAYYDSLKK